MINKKFLFAAVGSVAILVSALVLFYDGESEIIQDQYIVDNLLLKQKLEEHKITMSSPVRLQNPDDIEKYCKFFTNEEIQKNIGYCTSTELLDVTGKFLGNVHMVGSPNKPEIVLVLIQADPLMSQIDSIKTVFNIVIQNLVCDCWQQEKPGDIASLEEWVEGLRQFHLGDTKPHSKSKQLDLGSKTVQLELTTNKDGYVWQLIIYAESV